MGTYGTQVVRTLERRSAALFLGAGTLLIGYAALNGIAAGTAASYTTVEDVVGPAGFALGFLGLLGLWPTLGRGVPRIARTGAICAALGATGFSAIATVGFARLAEVLAEPVPAVTGVLTIVVTVGMLGGYTAAGVSCLRTESRNRVVGLLLLAPAVVFALMLSQAVVFALADVLPASAMAWSAVAISGGQAIAHLGIAHSLRNGGVPADRTVGAGEPTGA